MMIWYIYLQFIPSRLSSEQFWTVTHRYIEIRPQISTGTENNVKLVLQLIPSRFPVGHQMSQSENNVQPDRD
jgi:hypothetical protein